MNRLVADCWFITMVCLSGDVCECVVTSRLHHGPGFREFGQPIRLTEMFYIHIGYAVSEIISTRHPSNA